MEPYSFFMVYLHRAMNDIKIPGSQPPKRPTIEVSSLGTQEVKMHTEPGDKVRVNFEKFVQLVATHDFEEVMKAHAKEDIILSTNLLTDLANAHEEDEPSSSSRLPIIFAVGMLLGIVIAYIIIRFI